MKTFPAFLTLQNRPCLLAGGGNVAGRKARQLLKAGAGVTVVAPEIGAALSELHAEGKLKYIKGVYAPKMLEGVCLVIAATDDAALNQSIAAEAKSRNCLVNVVDNPEASTFIMPSVIRRDPVVIAVSTGGASPVLARLLKARLETLIPSGYGNLASLIERFRAEVKVRFPTVLERRRFWEKILQGPVAEMLYAGRDRHAVRLLEKKLADKSVHIQHHGEVYLVGGGPGDPDLLTFRALRLMQQADVVLYDHLVAPAIVALVRKDAERIYVGKERDRHTLPQQEINQLLVKLAKEGKRVLRLKGGDPFIFGRGGEEIDLLSTNHIPFQIVPGITAASGCASYAGIPLTHRDYAQSCLFITGHLKDGTMNLNWPALVQPQQTLVVYMGMHSMAVLSRQLMAHGLAGETPVAIVQRGTTREQRVYISTIKALATVSQQYDIKPPGVIIIGEVVSLHAKLAWFNTE